MEMMCEAPDVCFQQAVSAPGRTARGRQRPAFRQEAEDTARDAVRRLVLLQGADGSFGGDAERTAAAIVALLLLGHTTRRGTRRRVVEKAADWLRGHGPAGAAAHALRLLERADAGGPAPGYDEATPLFGAGEEGAILRLAAERTRA
jgi:hypothetical protein